MKEQQNKKRYETLRNHPGIRKDIQSGGYLATKSIKGKRSFRIFQRLSEAIHWKNTFNPDVESIYKSKEKDLPQRVLNGQDKGYLVKDVWEKYKGHHLSGMSFSTREVVEERLKFLNGMWEKRMVEIDPEFLDFYLKHQVDLAVLNNSKRFSFKEDLKRVRAFFNWYRENFDYTYRDPILKRHFIAGTIKKKIPKNKKMTDHQVHDFFQCLPDYWRDFAMVQFYLGARVSEVAGLTWGFVNFVEESIEIRKVAVYSRKKRFVELKELPKNGEARFCHITDSLNEILRRKFSKDLGPNDFVFTSEGNPLQYRHIQFQYDQGLKKAGLYPEFSGTHFLRHSMATITRRVTGSLESTQAVTGHKDQRLVQHYASLPSDLQKKAVNDVDAFMRSSKELKLIKS